MMAELLVIKGLLKRKYPTPGQGTALSVESSVTLHSKYLQYSATNLYTTFTFVYLYSVQGSLGANIPAMITKFLYGIKYSGRPHDRQPLYGLAHASFGKVWFL